VNINPLLLREERWWQSPADALGSWGASLVGALDRRPALGQKGGMATHDISLKIVHDITIMNKDIEVEIRADGDLLGRIRISRGIDRLDARP
jgi:hypothetical protein